jgi:prepilin peptidase CpaA
VDFFEHAPQEKVNITRLPIAIEIALAALVIVAAVFDLRFRRIPNWLVLTGICVGFALNGFLFGLHGLGRAGLGFAVAAAIYVPLFALRAMGAGDVKLMAAAGSMTGASNWFAVFLITAIAGGIIALGVLFFRGGLRRAVLNVLSILGALIRFRAPFRERPELDVADSRAVTMPHGVAIAAGSLLFIALSRNMK